MAAAGRSRAGGPRQIATFDGVGPALLSEYEVTPLIVRSVREALRVLDDERAIAALMEMSMVLNFRKRDPAALDDYVVSPSFRSVQYSFVLQQGSPYLRAVRQLPAVAPLPPFPS